jgi:hypothetical protein
MKGNKMRVVIANLVKKVTYLNLILTIIAILLGIQVAHNLGLFGPTNAHATSVTPVHIESVAKNIPVAIKEPISTYPGNVCVAPCR